MKITFLRHGSLLPPFDDYNSLSLDELSRLARQEIDPSVDPSKISSKLELVDLLEKKYDALFVSSSKRTHDTAKELTKKFDLPRLVELKEVNEILFDPSQLVSEKEYEQGKLAVIRKKLFKNLANDTNIEPGSSVADRIIRLDEIIHESKAEAVLVITHGFFMRYLDIFYRQKSRVFDENALNQAVNYDYVSGFTAIIS